MTEDDLRRALAAPPGPMRLADGARAEGLRPAAVLVAAIRRPGGLTVALTQRPVTMRDHAGQIAFPGGKIDPTDPTPVACALREAWEEIGLDPRLVEVLGLLPDYATRTGFAITPVVAVVDAAFRPVPEVGEVAEVFEAPLAHVADPARIERLTRWVDGAERAFWAVRWEGRFIWGATAGVLRALADQAAGPRP